MLLQENKDKNGLLLHICCIVDSAIDQGVYNFWKYWKSPGIFNSSWKYRISAGI